VPELVSVPFIGALVVLSAWAGKDTVVSESITTGAVPVPVSATDRVDLGVAPLSPVKVSGAVREPMAVGVNFTLQVQLAVATTVTPAAQLVPDVTMEKSDAFVPVASANWLALVPPSATVARFNVPVPLFIRVSV
jgi:hypothetical protein